MYYYFILIWFFICILFCVIKLKIYKNINRNKKKINKHNGKQIKEENKKTDEKEVTPLQPGNNNWITSLYC